MGLLRKIISFSTEELRRKVEEVKNEALKNLEETKEKALKSYEEKKEQALKNLEESISNARTASRNSECDVDAVMQSVQVDEPKVSLGKYENFVLEIKEGIEELNEDSIEEFYKRARRVILPSTLTKLEDNVFSDMKYLEELDFSKVNHLKKIPDEMITGKTSLKKLIIPFGVEVIGDSFIGRSPLTELYIPSTVKDIDSISDCRNNISVYLFASGIDIECLEDDVDTLYVLPKDYNKYSKQVRDEDLDIKLREIPEEKLNIYQQDLSQSSVDNENVFSSRLESLIEAALKDGVLTEKEREILKKRAEAEGEDWDEVEMLIEARLAESKSVNKIQTKEDSNNKELESIQNKVDTDEGRFYYEDRVDIVRPDNGILKISDPNIISIDFSGCSDLKEIKVPLSMVLEEDKKLTSVNFSGCKNLRKIKDQAFDNFSNLLSADFSGCTNLETIGSGVFNGCTRLSSVNFSGCTHLQTTGSSVFNGCTQLSSVDFSGCLRLQSIDDYAFEQCIRLESINFSGCNSLKTIGHNAFGYCNQLPFNDCFQNLANLKEIGCEAFSDVTMKECIVPDSVEFIGRDAFNCVEKIVFPASLKAVNSKLFAKNSILKVADLSKITSSICIEEQAFASSSLEEIILPDNIYKFDKWAFSECENLRSIVFPAMIKELGYGVFAACSGLESVDFSKVNSLTCLSEATFGSCVNLKEVQIPDSVETIEKKAFLGCKRLKSVVLPASLKEIGSGVFQSDILINLDMSKVRNLKTIPIAFMCSEKTISVMVPYGVRQIEETAFCCTLRQLFLPPTLESIGELKQYDTVIYCYSPKLHELEPLVEDIDDDKQVKLFVLQKFLDIYIAQRNAESISEGKLSIEPIPDEYLYIYDN